MKILLITHNPISTSNNMGKTFLSLFSQFSKDELCQLYVHPSLPDVDACHSYYRITDREALKGICLRCSVGGEVTSLPPRAEISTPASGIKNRNKPLVRLGRDLVWKLSHWYSKHLKLWLDQEAPTHIFLAPGYAKFIYDIALRIAKDRDIPIVTYLCDDYYFVKQPSSILERLRVHLLKKKTEVLMKKTACLVAICDEIKEAYHQAFGVPAVTIMTGTEIPTQRPKSADRTPASISYFGNVGCHRYRSLCDTGEALETINRQDHTAYALKVYTNEQDPEILKAFSKVPTIRLCGFVTGDAFKQAMAEADLLLHVEAFDEESIDLVKHSVSTKIADSLASGVPLIAYGPAEISSMKHLHSHQCALIATARIDLSLVLTKALTDETARRGVVDNALNTVKIYHDQKKNSNELKKIMKGYCHETA